MKTFYLLLGMNFLCKPSIAQFKRTPEDKALYYSNQLKTDVELDSSQFLRVYDINLKVSRRIDSLYALPLDEQSRKRSMIPIFRERDSLFRQVLSTVQFLKYDDMQRERRLKKLEEKKKAEKN